MTESHSKKVAALKPEELEVHFSPEVRRNFARLEAAVCDSEHFAPEMLSSLRDLADGKASSVRHTMLGVAAVIHEAGRHVRATHDDEVDELLTAIVEGLTLQKEGADPLTVVRTPVRKRGQG